MKGSNELKLNEATLIEAMQEYLDKRYTSKVAVQSVKQTGSGYSAEFTVAVMEIEKIKTEESK